MLTANKSKKYSEIFLIKFIVFGFVYFIVAKLGLMLATINQSVSPVWPATGLAFAILLLEGVEFWPSLFLGAFAINFLVAKSFLPAFFISCGNTLQALIGFWILNYINKHKDKVGNHSRTIGVILASLFGALTSSVIGSSSLCLTGHAPWNQYFNVFYTWFIGDALGGIVFLPFFLAFSKNYSLEFQGPKKIPNIISIILMSLGGLFLCWLLFIHREGSPYLFFIFPYLFWCVAQAGEKGITISTIVITLFGVCSVQMGRGVFNHGTTNSNLINLQLFLASVGISSLMMSDLKRSSPIKQSAIVIFSAWLLAGIFFFGFFLRSQRESDKQFQQIVDNVGPLLNSKINLYFSALQSGAGFLAANENVTRANWKAFIENGPFEDYLKATEGIGIIYNVHRNNLSQFIKKIQSEGPSDFFYHEFPNLTSDQIKLSQARNDYYIITYFETKSSEEEYYKNKLGLNILSEEKRRVAAELARDTALPTISDFLPLFGTKISQSVFIIYYPFYKKNMAPDSLSERRNQLRGFIFAPIVASTFFDSVFSLASYNGISYQITTNDSTTPILQSPNFDKSPKGNAKYKEIIIGNRKFNFHFRRTKDFYAGQDIYASWTGTITSIITLFIAAFIISLQTVKRNALLLAEKKTEALKANEELWKYALEGTGDSVWDWDIPNKKITYTKKLQTLLGYSNTEFDSENETWKNFIHPDDYDRVQEDLKNHFETGLNFVSEYRMRCFDGTYKWILGRGNIVERAPDNTPTRMVGTISDISHWKEVEAEIKRQKEKLNSIFEGSSDSLMIYSDKGILDCNARTLELFGYASKEELISLHPEDFSPPTQPNGVRSNILARQQIKKAFEKGSHHFEWAHKKKNGEVFPAEVLLTAFDYDNARIIQACIRDLTEKKLVDTALANEREKLMAAAKMSSLGEMAGGIAHEINNPLAIIIGKMAQIKRKINDAKEEFPICSPEEISTIENTAKRIASIVKSLSAFSRNAENDNMERISLAILFRDTLELSKERFRFGSIKLILDLEPSEKTYVTGRASQLLQVLVNLLNNAYDAVENLDDKWVEIKVTSENNICTISVTDSGPGIPEHILKKMMTPFFTTKEVGKGTGLGLSISKTIIEEHHGKLYYDINSAHTRFIVELPLA